MDIIAEAKKFMESKGWTVSDGINGTGILLKDKRCSPQAAVILATMAVGKGKRFAPNGKKHEAEESDSY